MRRQLLNYLLEASAGKGLTIFDIDETLFHTKAKINVMKDGKVISALDNMQFNTYKLKAGETFDYGQFKSAKIFNRTSTPIAKMINKAKAIITNSIKQGSKVIVVTARGDMDDKKLFVNTFKAQGLDMDNVYIERAGNIGLDSAAKNKEVVFRKYLDTGLYKRIRLFDDAVENLKALTSLKNEYPDVTFEAYRVKKDGSIQTMK
tara:strand:+ start:1079 stop:1690 length:612 start_codon:yes stop_codon:yes gene_type:complete